MKKSETNKWVSFFLVQVRDLFFAYLLSVFVTYFFMGNKLFEDFNVFSRNTQFGFLIAALLWKGNQFIGWYNNRRFPWKENPKLTFTMDLVFSITYSIIIIFIIYFYVFQILFKLNFYDNLSRIYPQMVLTLIISLLVTVLFYLFQFFKWWRISALNESKLHQEAIQLRYDALKSQVNPHFLFNSLSVLSSLVDTDTAKAKLFIQQFANIYRYVLEHRDNELVPLIEEIDFIKSFTNLHLVRHGENLQISIEVNDMSGYIIPLSLQILLENCFKHNIISEEKPLMVKIWRENNFIVVQNNYQKRNTIHDSGGVGLETICKRYEYISDREIEINVNGDFYTVKLPILNNIK